MAAMPASAEIVCPVTELAASETRNATTSAISSGSTRRRSGVTAPSDSSTPSIANSRRHISVATTPGATALERIPAGPYSIAVARVMPSSAALVAAYAVRRGVPRMPLTDEMLTIEPPGGDHRRSTAPFSSNTAHVDVEHRSDVGDGVVRCRLTWRVAALLTSTSAVRRRHRGRPWRWWPGVLGAEITDDHHRLDQRGGDVGELLGAACDDRNPAPSASSAAQSPPRSRPARSPVPSARPALPSRSPRPERSRRRC